MSQKKINLKDKKTILLICSVIILAIVVGVALFFTFNYEGKSVVMPDFKEKTVSDIEVWINDNNLSDQVEIVYEFDEEIEENVVITQSISSETKIKKEDKILITVSKGPDPEAKISIPDFKEMDVEEIQKFVEENKLMDVTYEYVLSDDVEKGKLIQTNIHIGTVTIQRNQMIIFTISKGHDESLDIIVPNFSGYTKNKVANWASANEVNVIYQENYSDTIERGYVISQDPKAESVITAKSKVTVTISLGKPVTVKSLAGMTSAEIGTWATQNNVKVIFLDYFSDTVEKDKAISNTPNSGKVSQQSTITVKRSQGKPNIEDYTNKTKTDFDAYLNKLNAQYNSSAKITVNVTYKYDDTVKKDSIISQDKKGSQNVGTVINLTVSKGKQITVIDLSGKSKEEINSWANTNKLLINYSSEKYNNNVAENSAISNDKVNEKVDEGTTINVVISKGKPNLGNYKGKSKNEFEAYIEALNSNGANLKVNYTESSDNTIQAGYIIENPTGAVNVGSTIQVKISTGAAPITVGNYVGKNANSLVVDGLNFNIAEYRYSDTVASGVILEQSVAQGTSVSRGTTINLVVSKGPEPLISLSNGYLAAYSSTALFEGSIDKEIAAIKANIQNLGFSNVTVELICSRDGHSAGLADQDLSTPPGSYKSSYPIKVIVYNGNMCE